jgi:hypothetical protein
MPRVRVTQERQEETSMSMQRRPRFLKVGWMPLLLVACSGNTSLGDNGNQPTNGAPLAVALNSRMFDSSSMASVGSGCNTYLLRPVHGDLVRPDHAGQVLG